MGVKTRLKDYGLDQSVIPAITQKLTEHNHVKLGEHADITPEDVRHILTLAL